MRAWERLWFTAGQTIGGVLATGRDLARRVAGRPARERPDRVPGTGHGDSVREPADPRRSAR